MTPANNTTDLELTEAELAQVTGGGTHLLGANIDGLAAVTNVQKSVNAAVDAAARG
jgi:bacteriocin-like protein